jgi:hypothetical protein
MKFLHYSKEGREYLSKYPVKRDYPPESLSLAYLKYYYRLYRDKELLSKASSVVGIKKELDVSHRAQGDVADTLVMLKFANEKLSLSYEKMFEISENPVEMERIHYGFLKGEKISNVPKNRLLWFLSKVDDEDLGLSIASSLLRRGESPSKVREAMDVSLSHLPLPSVKNSAPSF